MPMYVKNPKTGRPIKVSGATYHQLEAAGRNISGLKRFYKPSPKRRHSLKRISSRKRLPAKAVHRKYPAGRGAPTRGWLAAAPRIPSARRMVKAQCGAECFLAPKTLGFPICPKCHGAKCSCKLDCRGVRAAKARARQYKYSNIAAEADRILASRCRSRGRRRASRRR